MSDGAAGLDEPIGLPTTVCTVPPETPVFEVARAMVSEGVGNVLVAWDRKPIGLLTDRDLVVRVLAQGLNPKTLLAWEVMSKPLVLASGSQDLGEAVGLMARHGIRRLPIVDEAGHLISILTLDDILLLGLNGRPHLRAIIQGQLESNKTGGKPMAGEEQGLSFRNIAPITHAFSAAAAVARNRAQDVCTVISEAPIKEAAQAMVSRDVGDVFVVVDRKPVGILTDRDLVVRGMAVGADPETTLAWEVMTQPLVTVTDEEGVEGAVALMARHGVRRLPIVDEAGRLISVLTLDDILLLDLNGDLDLSEILKRQLRPRVAPPPETTVEPSRSRPPSVIPAPFSKMREAPPSPPPAQPMREAQLSQPHEPPPVTGPSPQPKLDRAAAWPDHLSRSGSETGFGTVRFSQPITSVARKVIIKPLVLPPKTRLDFAREWYFQSRDWLLLTAWLVLFGILAALVAYHSTQSEWFKLPADVYEP